MNLYYSSNSPYARKLRVLAIENHINLNLIEIDLKQPSEHFKSLTPLAKVPILEVDDKVLFDSTVIFEYLDSISLKKFETKEKFLFKQLESFADGLCDCAVNILLEERRPIEKQMPMLIKKNEDKIINSLTKIDEYLDQYEGNFNYDSIFFGVAINYLLLIRKDILQLKFRNIQAFLNRINCRKSFSLTAPKGY
ncbi:MAG: glutathione S-transferase N-terminal domain-containing protein [Nitrosomonadales bacterium]